MKVTIQDAFCLRPEDQLFLGNPSESEKQEGDYAIMLLGVPPLPTPSHSDCTAFTVLCAQLLSGLWRWVALGPTTKDALLLILLGKTGGGKPVEVGKWHLMRILPKDMDDRVAELEGEA